MGASYLKFWNRRAKALVQRHLTFKEVNLQKIDEDWRFEQEKILKEEADVLNKIVKTAPPSLKVGTLRKNMSAIDQACHELRNTKSKLQKRKQKQKTEKI